MPASDRRVDMATGSTGPRRAGVVFGLLLALLAAGIAAAGLLAYRGYRDQSREEIGHQLSAIADLKVAELARWRRERLGDALLLSGNPAFAALVERRLAAPADQAAEAALVAWLGRLRGVYEYERVSLLDAHGTTLLAIPPSKTLPAPDRLEGLAALAAGGVRIVDLHRDSPGGPVRMAVTGPVSAADGRTLGTVVLTIDPATFLFPFLGTWPTPSRTAETLLVRREGDAVLFLNERRFRKDGAVGERRPLTDAHLPAVQAALGREGLTEGADYRGVEVVAALRAVPESPWRLVARLDKEEIEAPVRERLGAILALGTLTLLAAGSGLGLLWRQQGLAAARERYQSSEALRASEARAALESQTIVRTTQDGFWSCDGQGRFLDVNESLCRMLGRSREELLQLAIPDIEARETPAEAAAHGRRLRESGQDRFETRHRHKDGSVLDVEVSATYSPTLDRVFVFARDVSERRRIERELRLKDLVFESSLAAGSIADTEGRILHVNTAFLRLWRYETEEAALGQSVATFFVSPQDGAAVLRTLDETGSWEGEFLARRRDGTTFVSRGLATVIRDASGARIGYQSTNLDASALREAEQRFRLASETSSDVIYEWDLRQSITWFGRIDELTGYAPGTFPRTLAGWEEILHPQDRPRVMTALRAQLDGLAPYAVEYRLRAGDGSYRWWAARGVVARLPDGTPTRWVGTVTDITDRRRAENALRESEAFLDSVFEHSPHAMWLSDSRGTLIRLNQACRDLLKITDAEVVGRYNVLEDGIVAAQGHRPLVRGVFERAERARFTIDYRSDELKEIALEQHVALVLDVTISPIVDSGGRVSHAIVQHVDITERVRAQEALRASATRYRRLHESMMDAFVLVDMEGRILETNPAYRELVGYDEDELARLSYEALTPARWHPLEARLVAEQILPNGHSEVYEKEYVCKDGRTLPVELRTFLLRDESGAPTGMWAIVRDIEQRKRAEAEIRQLNAELEQRVADRTARLEAANQELEAFSYSVSHDLRAPLRHIDGFVGLLLGRSRATLDEQGRHYLDVVAESARQMSRLIDDLLQLSRTGRTELHESGVDMNRTLREALDSLDSELVERRIEWRLDELPTVRGDRAMLRLVWQNLLGNAVKYTRTRATAHIEVGFREEPGEISFFVRDDGVGFDMRYAHKLFGVFQRLHPASEFEGTGIGLATVRRIVTRHGGRTWAEATLGAGATIHFSLPKPRSEA